MKQLITALVFSLCLFSSCEKEKSEPINQLESYLQDYSGEIYQYSIGSNKVAVDPAIDISFLWGTDDYNAGYIESHYFNWGTPDDTTVSIKGDFFANLPVKNLGGMYTQYLSFRYHQENVNAAIKLDTFIHVCNNQNVIYYLRSE